MKEKPGKVVAERAYTRRRQLGITQEELSQRSGLRQGMISQIEAGKNMDIAAGTLMALAKGLGVSLDYLVGLTDEATETPLPPAPKRGRRPAQVGASGFSG